MIKHLSKTIACILVFLQAQSQINSLQQDTSGIKHLPANYLDKVSSRASQLEEKLDAKTQKALLRMQKQEQKLRAKLAKKDSAAAVKLFGATEEKYAGLQARLKQAGEVNPQNLGSYIPYFDTLKTTLKFLEKNGQNFLSSSSVAKEKLNEAMQKVNALDFKLSQAQSIQQFLKERRQYLKEQLSKFDLARHLKKMNKEVFYYSQLVKDYKSMLKDPRKIEAKAMALLREIPAFKKFMQQNSQLASIFGVPTGNPGSLTLAGLQSRASVQQLISTLPINGANPQQFVSQQLQTANEQLSQAKKSIRRSSLIDNYGEMPNFKPNGQKTKSFFKRLEYGANVQFGKVNRFLPATGDFALSVGYKLNDDGVIGIGTSYKLGLGTGFNNIRFSHQGFGMRSYIDWRIKGGFYISGGYEKNNLPQLNNITAPVSLATWQESGLIGITKKYPVKKKKGYVQLLFDFLSYKNTPRSHPVLFRTGINF